MKRMLFIILFGITQTAFANTIFYIPYAVGGASDIVGRLVTKNSKELVPINKPGASGQLAIQEMNANPSVLLITNFTMYVTNPIIYKNTISYNIDNYEVLAIAGIMPGVLACNKKTGINNINDLLNYKDKLVLGTSIPGGAEHLNTEVLLTKINKNDLITVLPYNQGGIKQYVDLIGGHIDCVFGNLPTMLTFINDDKLNLIISTHDISHIKKGIPVWRSTFNEDFYFESLTIIVIDKRYPDKFKNKMLVELKSLMDTVEFKNELINRGLIPLVVFDKNAKEINDKYNNTVRDFILKTKIFKD